MQRVGQAHQRSSTHLGHEHEDVAPDLEHADPRALAGVLITAAGAGLTGLGLLRRGSGGLLIAAAGATLGALGLRRLKHQWNERPVTAHGSVTIDAPRGDIFRMWRELSNLPRFMRHVVRVEDLGNGRAHWRVRLAPRMPELEWDTRVIEQQPDERITWRTIDGASVSHEGTVSFVDAPGGRGTEVHARLVYRPGTSAVGSAAARLVHPAIGHELKEDLRRLKQLMEAGEIPTGQARSSFRA